MSRSCDSSPWDLQGLRVGKLGGWLSGDREHRQCFWRSRKKENRRDARVGIILMALRLALLELAA